MKNMSENIFFNEINNLKEHEEFIKKDISYEELKSHYNDLIKSYKRLLKQTQKISKISDINHRLLNETKTHLKLLLDNSEEGFLAFGKDFLVYNEYSHECLNIFNMEDISKKNIFELLFEKDYDIEKRIFEHIFEDSEKEDVYLELLPQEIKRKDKILKVRYKIIYMNSEKRIMCIIKDITEKKQLEKNLEIEKNNNKMLLNVIIYKDLVKKYIDDYLQYVTSKIYEDIELYTIEKFISEFYRKIHTYKGIFLQWNMLKFGKELDKLENEINILKESNIKSKAEIISFIKKKKMDTYLMYELDLIKKVLGKEFLNNEMIWVDKKKILSLEEYVQKSIPEDQAEYILKELKRLYYKDFNNLFNMYKNYTIDLAEKFEKKIDNFIVEVDDNILFDPEIFYNFNKSLIHIFRNIIVHGIEYPQERSILGKSYGGNIYCKVYTENNEIHIKISDDGKGIDKQKLKEKAEKENIKEKDILNLIFRDGITTKENPDEYGGKGVGLSAVKEEIEKLNGKILVYSEENKGTTFEFILPENF
ncbi:hypothetical protein XO10_01475 [Marinitoga sp. 1135]|uniref:ATP-binding protein n=1 Tax=Marinitoga sp. 1135 TaxID=1643333 RepID=UPI0015862F2F|nr:ATP-binding protein [Marinitoga sp. 1135]NUU94987.1 hypothetical protein [Marinitoga sp. 1135]